MPNASELQRLDDELRTVSKDAIRAVHLERSELLDRLSQARILLARVKAILLVNKRHQGLRLQVTFTDVDQQICDEITKFMDAGLFGNGGN